MRAMLCRALHIQASRMAPAGAGGGDAVPRGAGLAIVVGEGGMLGPVVENAGPITPKRRLAQARTALLVVTLPAHFQPQGPALRVSRLAGARTGFGSPRPRFAPERAPPMWISLEARTRTPGPPAAQSPF